MVAATDTLDALIDLLVDDLVREVVAGSCDVEAEADAPEARATTGALPRRVQIRMRPAGEGSAAMRLQQAIGMLPPAADAPREAHQKSEAPCHESEA